MKIEITDEEAYSLVGALIFVSRLEEDKELSLGIHSLADKVSKQHLDSIKDLKRRGINDPYLQGIVEERFRIVDIIKDESTVGCTCFKNEVGLSKCYRCRILERVTPEDSEVLFK